MCFNAQNTASIHTLLAAAVVPLVAHSMIIFFFTCNHSHTRADTHSLLHYIHTITHSCVHTHTHAHPTLIFIQSLTLTKLIFFIIFSSSYFYFLKISGKTGLIVGLSIGGVAVAGAIVFGVFFFMRRRRHHYSKI